MKADKELKKEPSGLYGWLVFWNLGIPFMLVIGLVLLSEVWGVFIYGCIVWLAYVYFNEKKAFLRTIKVLLSVTIAFYVMVLFSYLIVEGIPPQELQDGIISSIAQILASSIWLAYFIKSRRVKNTFVN